MAKGSRSQAEQLTHTLLPQHSEAPGTKENAALGTFRFFSRYRLWEEVGSVMSLLAPNTISLSVFVIKEAMSLGWW